MREESTPAPRDHDPVDPRDRKHHHLQQDPEPSEAVKLYLQAANEAHHPQTPSPLVRDQIDKTVTDLDKWKRTLFTWSMHGHRWPNVADLLDVYKNGYNGNGRHGTSPPPREPLVNAAGLTYNEHTAKVCKGELPSGTEWHPVTEEN